MLACRFGMRGRLWLLWSTMTFGGLFTCIMGVAGDSFAATQVFVILAATGIEVRNHANSLGADRLSVYKPQ